MPLKRLRDLRHRRTQGGGSEDQRELNREGLQTESEVSSPHVNDLTHIDCQGLAGHWTYATGTVGFDLVHRASLGAFGDAVVESNRHLIPGPWEQDTGNGPDEWEPAQAVYLTGTPPCSGFSLLNNSKKNNSRGPESSINDCMKELIAYAARCTGADGRPGPEIVAFESVQGAFTQGRSLMQYLRDDMERRTGQKYNLHHCLTAGATIGAAQMRHRYYFLIARIPFGIDEPEKRRVVTYKDAIGDLMGLEDTWDTQFVRGNHDQLWWLIEQNMLSVGEDFAGNKIHRVDSHIGADNPRIRILLDHLEPYWPAGKSMETAMVNYYNAHGTSPEGAGKWWLEEGKSLKGFAHPTRINPGKPGYVCTGGCVFDFVHWAEPRMLTVRECSRLMGLPDYWSWTATKTVAQAGAFTGKCCPVQTGRWISTWAKRAIQGNPGAQMEEIGDREFYHNSTNLYRGWLKEQQSA